MYSSNSKRVFSTSIIAGLCLLFTLVTGGCSSQSTRAQRYFDRGKRYFDQQKYAEASIEFQSALKRNSTLREAHYYLGLSQFRLRDYVGAYRELQGVVESAPSFLPARLDLAELFLTGNEPEKAREQVEAVQAIEAGNVAAQILLGRTYLAQKNAARAIQEFDKAKQMSPADPSVWGLSAVAEIAEKQYGAAEHDARRAIELAPYSADSYINLSNLFRMTGRISEAEAILREGMAKIPKATSLDFALADVYYQQDRFEDIEVLFTKRKTVAGGPPADLAIGDFWLAHNQMPRAIAEYEDERRQRPSDFVDRKLVSAYITVGRAADAENLNTPLLKKYPKDADLRTFDGAIAYFKNDFQKASEELQAVVRDEPKSLMANYYLGLTWMAVEQPDRARVAFLQCVSLNDQFFHAYVKLADLAGRSGDWQTVSVYGKTLLRLNPQAAEGYLALGEGFLASRDTPSAKKVLHFFGALPNVPAEFYELSAQLGLVEGNQKAASDALHHALSLARDQLAVMSRFSAFASKHSQTETALVELKQWMAGQPPQAASYELLAQLYFQQHEVDSATVACRKALEINSARWLPHFLLGEIARQRKQFPDAEAEFAETIKRNPRMISAYLAAGEMEMGQGQYDKAKSYFDAAKKQNPDSIAANRGLIQWYADRGENLDVALTDAQELKARFPEDQYLSDTLGWLYYQKRLYSLALQQLKPAASSLTENATVQYHLGMTYFRIGAQNQARVSLKRALKLGLTSAAATQAQETLGQLSKG